MAIVTGGVETCRADVNNKLLVGQTTDGSGGKLSVNGTFSLGTTATGTQTFMSTVGMHWKSGITGIATTIVTDIVQGLSSAASAFVLIYGADNAGSGSMDVVACFTSGTPVVVHSITLSGAPAARTYTMSGSDLQLSIAAGTYSVNCRCTSMGYPF